MSVCFKVDTMFRLSFYTLLILQEKIQIKPEALTELIIGCGQDVRQVGELFEMLSLR